MIKLDVVYYGFVLGHGGDAVQMLDLAEGVQHSGLNVRVILPNRPEAILFAKERSKSGLDIVITNQMHVDLRASRQDPDKLADLFSSNPAHVLHFHTGDFCLSRAVPRVLSSLTIPPENVMVTVHSPYEVPAKDTERASAWASAAGSRIRYIVCPSHRAEAVQRSIGVPESCLAHVPNGVNLSIFRSGNGDRVRREIGLAPDCELLLFASRLDHQKRPMDALDGFAKISADYPKAHLVFAGEGELGAALTKRAGSSRLEERVHFVGHRFDIPDWLAASTVWMLPTEIENFSIALLEALAAGKPILSTMSGGNAEVLMPEVNALIHEVGDVDGIAAGLERLLSSETLRTSLSSNARATSESYSSERMVQAYQALYSRMGLTD